MPWRSSQAKAHTQRANTPKRKRQWAHTANNVLKRTGDEARAIRTANAVVGRKKKRR